MGFSRLEVDSASRIHTAANIMLNTVWKRGKTVMSVPQKAYVIVSVWLKCDTGHRQDSCQIT